MTATAIILAAGMGTRMKSARPKVLHEIAGRPMLRHLIGACEAAFDRIVVVTGPGMEAVAEAALPHASVVQQERLGTAHAALQAAGLFGEGEVAVLYGDNPLIAAATLLRLRERLARGDAGLVLLATRPPDPARYGRVLSREGYVERIVEWIDASEAERAETLCNAGVFVAPAARMRQWLGAVRADNAKGEYYLTDIVAGARAEGVRVAAVEAPFAQCRGVNSRAELAEAEASVQAALRLAAMDAGATLIGPETIFLAADTVLEPDTVVGPYVVFGPGVAVRRGAVVRAHSHLEGCEVGRDAIVGPFARLRPGTVLGAGAHVGNFVELKAASLGDGAKANHLSYIGDAVVGARTNIGAGTITCNYDGVAKHRTTIGADVFVGSDSVLVAPISLGDGAFVAAGSTITENVPERAMALGRARQVTKPGRAPDLKTRKAARLKKG